MKGSYSQILKKIEAHVQEQKRCLKRSLDSINDFMFLIYFYKYSWYKSFQSHIAF